VVSAASSHFQQELEHRLLDHKQNRHGVIDATTATTPYFHFIFTPA
jgi:hypothetical protein